MPRLNGVAPIRTLPFMDRTPEWAWWVFAGALVLFLAMDLLSHRGKHGDSYRAAVFWTVFWIGVGLAFNVFVWVVMGPIPAQEYLAAYLMEKSLSVDNLFVFLIIFSSLNIPKEHQHKVLWLGIFGALVFRAIFIFLGAEALERYEWVAFVFGGLLLWAAWRTFRHDPTEERENAIASFLARHLPVSQHHHEGQFVAYENGRRVATSLLIAVIALELTDILFAVDSVPAAFSVTRDTFLVYTSNAFAILGLRALYLVIARVLEDLKYLHFGLAAVLAFAGLKMLLHDVVEIPPLLSVGIIGLFIGVAVLASVAHVRRERRREQERAPEGRGPPGGRLATSAPP